MPRATSPKNDFLEDSATEEIWEDWDTISEGFGEKITWEVGNSLIAQFIGLRDVPMEAGKDGNVETAIAAEFIKVSNGEKVWCWQPYALKEALTPENENGVQVGETIAIKCTGEQPTKRGQNPVKTFTIKRKPK